MNRFTIKNAKTFEGMDGYGYTCTLYMDGKRTGTVIEEGRGGQPYFRISDKVLDAFEDEACRIFGDQYGNGVVYDSVAAREALIAKLVDDFEELKTIKRNCRTKVLFRLHGDEEGVWRTVKGKWGDAGLTAWMEKKYGDKIETIANRDRI